MLKKFRVGDILKNNTNGSFRTDRNLWYHKEEMKISGYQKYDVADEWDFNRPVKDLTYNDTILDEIVSRLLEEKFAPGIIRGATPIEESNVWSTSGLTESGINTRMSLTDISNIKSIPFVIPLNMNTGTPENSSLWASKLYNLDDGLINGIDGNFYSLKTDFDIAKSIIVKVLKLEPWIEDEIIFEYDSTNINTYNIYIYRKGGGYSNDPNDKILGPFTFDYVNGTNGLYNKLLLENFDDGIGSIIDILYAKINNRFALKKTTTSVNNYQWNHVVFNETDERIETWYDQVTGDITGEIRLGKYYNLSEYSKYNSIDQLSASLYNKTYTLLYSIPIDFSGDKLSKISKNGYHSIGVNNITSSTDTGLLPNTDYLYRIKIDDFKDNIIGVLPSLTTPNIPVITYQDLIDLLNSTGPYNSYRDFRIINEELICTSKLGGRLSRINLYEQNSPYISSYAAPGVSPIPNVPLVSGDILIYMNPDSNSDNWNNFIKTHDPSTNNIRFEMDSVAANWTYGYDLTFDDLLSSFDTNDVGIFLGDSNTNFIPFSTVGPIKYSGFYKITTDTAGPLDGTATVKVTFHDLDSPGVVFKYMAGGLSANPALPVTAGVDIEIDEGSGDLESVSSVPIHIKLGTISDTAKEISLNDEWIVFVNSGVNDLANKMNLCLERYGMAYELGNVDLTSGYDFGDGLERKTEIITLSTAGIDQGDYFEIFSPVVPTDYYVWYDIDAAGTGDPALVGYTGIEVDIVTGWTDEQVATATAAAIHGAIFTASSLLNVVTIINADKGVCDETIDGTAPNSTGFTITEINAGYDVDLGKNKTLNVTINSGGIIENSGNVTLTAVCLSAADIVTEIETKLDAAFTTIVSSTHYNAVVVDTMYIAIKTLNNNEDGNDILTINSGTVISVFGWELGQYESINLDTFFTFYYDHADSLYFGIGSFIYDGKNCKFKFDNNPSLVRLRISYHNAGAPGDNFYYSSTYKNLFANLTEYNGLGTPVYGDNSIDTIWYVDESIPETSSTGSRFFEALSLANITGQVEGDTAKETNSNKFYKWVVDGIDEQYWIEI